jgi:hypothetical protein
MMKWCPGRTLPKILILNLSKERIVSSPAGAPAPGKWIRTCGVSAVAGIAKSGSPSPPHADKFT